MAALTTVLLTLPQFALTHCDTLDGRVVKAGLVAFETGEPASALAWVKPADESEVRTALSKARAIRKLGADARELADRCFLEPLVRMHGTGEGAPFTGLKPAGSVQDAAILAAAPGSRGPQNRRTCARKRDKTMPEKTETEKTQKVIIVGSGPAGLTAALYAARAGLAPVVFEGDQPGGQLITTTDVENFPGFPAGVQGTELMSLFHQQAEHFGAICLRERVEAISLAQRPFTVTSGNRTTRAQTLIVATGASARYLGLPSEQSLRATGGGVSACATCDGFFYRGKTVAVVGGGDTALEEASFLTRFCTTVHLVHRRDKLRGSALLQSRVLANPKIRVVWSSVVEEVLDVSQGRVTGLRLRNTQTGHFSTLEVDGLFVAIGHNPNTELLAGQLERNDKGYLCVDERTRTNVPGVFACGDCADFRYRQAITAAGTGCQSAMEAIWFLEERAT